MCKFKAFIVCFVCLVALGIPSGAQTFIITSLTPNPVCAGATLTANYTRGGGGLGVDTLVLSNSSGSFLSGTTNLGTFTCLVACTTGSIAATIPTGINSGGNYKVYVKPSIVDVVDMPSVESPITINGIIGSPVFSPAVPPARCQGSGSVTYLVTAANATNITYFVPMSVGSVTSASGSVTVNYNSTFSGNAVVTATASGTCGANMMQTYSVPVNAAPTLTNATSKTICSGSPVALTLTGGNSYSWTYNPPGNGITNSGTGSGTYGHHK